MRSSRQFRSFRSYPDALPFGVKWLLISNIVVFFLSILFPEKVIGYFQLDPNMLVHRFAIWQLVTYMFLHGGLLHILFNMLTLYWFGPDLERTWGTPRFLKFYFICGVGAGICFSIVELLSPVVHPTIGASGAIYGILMAYGMLFPDRTVLFFFIIPMKIRHLVWLMGLMALYFSVAGGNAGVANVAHLGGLAVGYVYMKTRFARFDTGMFSRRYQQWKMQRAKKKFQVYMRKHGGPGGTMLQ
jgi:membrane associated rhomboid family serine protease